MKGTSLPNTLLGSTPSLLKKEGDIVGSTPSLLKKDGDIVGSTPTLLKKEGDKVTILNIDVIEKPL